MLTISALLGPANKLQTEPGAMHIRIGMLMLCADIGQVIGVGAAVVGDMSTRKDWGIHELDFVFSTIVVRPRVPLMKACDTN
jgi:Protein RETICULATA-related